MYTGWIVIKLRPRALFTCTDALQEHSRKSLGTRLDSDFFQTSYNWLLLKFNLCMYKLKSLFINCKSIYLLFHSLLCIF